MDKTTDSDIGDGNVYGDKEDKAMCNRCGDIGDMTVRCPEQIYGACGRKGHSAEICANIITVFACEAGAGDSDGDTILNVEQDAFAYDARGKFLYEFGEGICSTLAW